MKKYFHINWFCISRRVQIIGAMILILPCLASAENTPIGDGTQSDPIVIFHKNPKEVVEAQYAELTSIMRRESLLRELQNQKLLWRVLIAEPIDLGHKTITKLVVDTKAIGESYTESEVKDIYFDSSASETPLPKNYVAYHHADSGISFPGQLGWLHFKGSHDYEPQNPGLGQSVSYFASGMTATFYLYDLGSTWFPESIEHPEVSALFERNVSEVMAANPGAARIGSPENLGNFLVQKFELDAGESVLGLAVCPDYFAKFRATSSKNVELQKALLHSLMAFMSLARENGCAKGVWAPQ